MRVLLELLRVIFIILIGGALMSFMLQQMYAAFDISSTWLGSIGILLLLFVLYRNKFQFSGWYKGEGRKRLPKKISNRLLTAAVFFIMAPVFMEILPL